MRWRSTFVHDSSLEFDPSDIKITENGVSFVGLKAAREERLTYDFKELPAELTEVLQRTSELHVRWQSNQPYNVQPPFVSRLTPGLHVQYTPLQQDLENDLICPLLHKVFSSELKCQPAGKSFTRSRSTSGRSISKLYSYLDATKPLVMYLQRDLCQRSDVVCIHLVALLHIADYFDIDYDGTSKVLTMTIHWSKPPAVLMDPVGEWTTYDHWNFAAQVTPGDRGEVGVLTSSPASDPHELQLSGFLTVLGRDNSPSPTLFSFPSRHQKLTPQQESAQAYSVSFQQPTGLHPTMQISFDAAQSLRNPDNKPASSVCTLNAYFTFPSAVFADEYAFGSDDRLFYEAHNLRGLRHISGELDLEAPNYVVDKWGSTMLLELATPEDTSSQEISGSWNVTVPLHLRYLEPCKGGLVPGRIPWPVVFWACTTEEDVNFSQNPFDRVNLGYDDLFDTKTMFYHLQPHPTSGEAIMAESVIVPVIDTSQVSIQAIDLGTVAVILLGFIWVLIKLIPGLLRESGLNKITTVKLESRKKKQ